MSKLLDTIDPIIYRVETLDNNKSYQKKRKSLMKELDAAIKALLTDKLSQLVRDGEIDMITTDVERIVESL